VCLGAQLQSCPRPCRKALRFMQPFRRPLFLPAEPYTCGACGIQFQFYNNLLEHMQSHAGKDPAAPLPSLPPTSSKGQGQPGATPPGDRHRTWSVLGNPG